MTEPDIRVTAVAPCVGAWIESPYCQPTNAGVNVAHHAGALIEINRHLFWF